MILLTGGIGGGQISAWVATNEQELQKEGKLPWTELDAVARYVVHYENGTAEAIPVTYGSNIGYHNRRQNAPLRNPVYRHNGYTATYACDSETVLNSQAEPETLYVYEHSLQQHPPIASITLEQEPAFDARVYVDSIRGVQL